MPSDILLPPHIYDTLIQKSYNSFVVVRFIYVSVWIAYLISTLHVLWIYIYNHRKIYISHVFENNFMHKLIHLEFSIQLLISHFVLYY